MKDRTVIYFLIIMNYMLIGCSNSTRYHWIKAGTSEQENYQDAYQCKRESRTRYSRAAGSTYSSDEYSDPELYEACMRAKGYNLLETKKVW